MREMEEIMKLRALLSKSERRRSLSKVEKFLHGITERFSDSIRKQAIHERVKPAQDMGSKYAATQVATGQHDHMAESGLTFIGQGKHEAPVQP